MKPTLRELGSICQKPQWRTVGSLLARRFARPLALYVTWLVVRWPLSANVVTGFALAVGWAASACLAMPAAHSFIAGAVLLQLWYLLDHVDGQVARYHNAESVTGVYFDFMMHHLVHAPCAFALGYGIAMRRGELPWTLAGAGFAMGLMVLSLSNDCRYKAFFAAIRRRGGLRSAGIGSGPPALVERPATLRLVFVAMRLPRLLCEIPNITLALTVLAVWVAIDAGSGLGAVQWYTLAMSLLAPTLGIAHVAKQVWCGGPDAEFREFTARSS